MGRLGLLVLLCYLLAVTLFGPTIAESKSCVNYGSDYEKLPGTPLCYEVGGYIRGEALLFPPENPSFQDDDLEFNARLRVESNIITESEIGVLAAFIRFQTDYDPGIFDDLIVGATGRDYQAGLEAFQLKLHRGDQTWRVGKIESAAATFISDGFTDRGSESLDARSGLGISHDRRFGAYDVSFSISDPRDTTSATPISPNFGIGIRRKVKKFSFNLGGAVLNVDDIIIPSDILQALEAGDPVVRSETARIGYGLGADITYRGERNAAFAGITYAKDSANDSVFSFSDGFDAVTFYAGIHRKLTSNVSVNLDLNYVTAAKSGLQQFNGVDAAINAVWRPGAKTQLLLEFGYDSIDRFGAGTDNFFQIRNSGSFDALLQLQREF